MTEKDSSIRKPAHITKDWTKGSITRNLISLTWPMLITQLITMLGPFVDMIWVGKLGSASIAGVGIASLAVFLANSATFGLATGMRAMVARFIGAGDKEKANKAAYQAYIVGFFYSIIIATIGIFLAEPIMRLFKVEPEVISEGAAYLRIQFAGILSMCLQLFSIGMMQASGDTVVPMRISIVARGIHIVLCPFLVLGWWIFPALGVSGAAITGVISQSLGSLMALWILFSGRTRLKLVLSNFRLDLNVTWRMIQIGLPNLFMHVQQMLASLVMAWFIARFGTVAVASHTVWQQTDSVILTLGAGIGVSAGVLGAQNLGARMPERAEQTGLRSIGFVEGLMAICAIAVLVWAEEIVLIFNHEPELVMITSSFIRIGAASYLFLGINTLLMSFLTGVGTTLPALLLEVIPTWCILMPLVYYIANFSDLGVTGLRWAIVIRHIVAAACFLLYFKLGGWKRKEI